MVKDVPNTLASVIEEVQEQADRTQSEAFHYHAAGDGSIVEIRCAPEPKYRGELPDITEHNDGFLAEKGGKLYKATPKLVQGGNDPGELVKADDGKRYRTVYTTPPEVEDEFVLVEFDWEEVDFDWNEHATKKARDVRLYAHPDGATAARAALRR
jgi:hypothetical protein